MRAYSFRNPNSLNLISLPHSAPSQRFEKKAWLKLCHFATHFWNLQYVDLSFLWSNVVSLPLAGSAGFPSCCRYIILKEVKRGHLKRLGRSQTQPNPPKCQMSPSQLLRFWSYYSDTLDLPAKPQKLRSGFLSVRFTGLQPQRGAERKWHNCWVCSTKAHLEKWQSQRRTCSFLIDHCASGWEKPPVLAYLFWVHVEFLLPG